MPADIRSLLLQHQSETCHEASSAPAVRPFGTRTVLHRDLRIRLSLSPGYVRGSKSSPGQTPCNRLSFAHAAGVDQGRNLVRTDDRAWIASHDKAAGSIRKSSPSREYIARNAALFTYSKASREWSYMMWRPEPSTSRFVDNVHRLVGVVEHCQAVGAERLGPASLSHSSQRHDPRGAHRDSKRRSRSPDPASFAAVRSLLRRHAESSANSSYSSRTVSARGARCFCFARSLRLSYDR
jgi:hypothetical protein